MQWLLPLILWGLPSQAPALDLSSAIIVFPPDASVTEKKTVTMLVEEVEKRTQIRWLAQSTWPDSAKPVIALGKVSPDLAWPEPYKRGLRTGQSLKTPEAFQIQIVANASPPAVLILGNDVRGEMFGVGQLLRALHMTAGHVTLDDDFRLVTAPRYPLRGHQLGYRPKTNSYDAWDLDVWEQYFRDLIVFGCNAIELIPPRSDDDATSPHFPRPPMEMMIGMSKLAEDYGLDVWIWYPAMDKDYSNPKTVEFAVQEWGEVFKKLPRLDAVFVPGGDPGHTPPKYLTALLEKQTQNLLRYHPKAQMWVSPQSFTQPWLDEFLNILTEQKPAWLSGVVFGPQTRMGLPKLRAAIPAQYPIRHYPDITHSRQCQYPVPDWDTAFAITEARECINPRPIGEAGIFRATQSNTIGFLTYSEGCNDDVNKAIWSSLGWNPEASVPDLLRQYSRYFIGEAYADDFAQGLLALEKNWQGPLLANEGVETTLEQFAAMEKSAAPETLKNWRFQQGLFRAYYDAYIRRRLLYETALEDRALERLRETMTRNSGEKKDDTGAIEAMVGAEKILNSAVQQRAAPELRARIFELAEALYQSIRAQLSVEKYGAIGVDRGAMLDTLDYPLNNRRWLKERFRALRKLASEQDRLKGIQEILEWTNPGPGGFYDDLGNIARQPHLVRGPQFEDDPGSITGARAAFEEDLAPDEPNEKPLGARRLSWINHAESLFDGPLKMRYPGLDPKARYKIRVVYGGDSPGKKIRLVANDHIEIHPFITKELPFKPMEFEVPWEATQTGELNLSWDREQGLGGNGRGCQVSEIWLMKK